jgi:hypothetical protein
VSPLFFAFGPKRTVGRKNINGSAVKALRFCFRQPQKLEGMGLISNLLRYIL